MALANPVQTWETDAGFAPDDIDIDRVAGDVLRYKVVPNNVDARTANSVALKKLLAASGRSRFEGRLRFANTTGSDTYHFDDFVEIKDGVHIDLQGCTLAFTKTYAMAAAAGLSVTLVPVLMGYMIRGRIPDERSNPLNR